MVHVPLVIAVIVVPLAIVVIVVPDCGTPSDSVAVIVVPLLIKPVGVFAIGYRRFTYCIFVTLIL